MPDNQSYGLVPSHQLTSAAVPGSPPVSAGHRTGKGGAYDGLPTDDAGDKDSTTYPSAAFSSPALPTTGGLDSPSTPFKSMEEVKRFDELKKKDTALKSRIRRLKFVLRAATLVLGLYTIITMSLTFHKFFSTRDSLADVVTAEFPGPGGAAGGGGGTNGAPSSTTRRGPWANGSILWPTTLLLVTSIISFLVASIVMFSYLRGIRTANAASQYGSYFSATVLIANTGLWIAVAVAYRAGRTRSDLWGWSCETDVQERLQQFFIDVVDFEQYCNVQTSSWIASMLQAVVMVFFVLVHVYGYKRLRGQRAMTNQFEEAYQHREGFWSKMVPTRHK